MIKLITDNTTLPAEFTLGADPELFGFIGKKPVSVHEYLSGDKQNPHKVKGGAVQVDGTSAEFNIDPCKTKYEFVSRINSVRDTMQSMISEKNPDVVLKAEPWVRFEHNYFQGLPPEVKLLGCDPDFNSFKSYRTEEGKLFENPRPNPEALGIPTVRTGSGHIHIGWDVSDNAKVHLCDCRHIVNSFQSTIGSSYRKWDASNVRKNLYGAPGAFRPKSYGVELRFLSNKWVDNQYAQEFLFDVVNYLVAPYANGAWAPYPVLDKALLDTNWRKH